MTCSLYPFFQSNHVQDWSIQNATDLPIFKALANMPDRAATFAGIMIGYFQLTGFSPQCLISAFPWGPGNKLVVVDVGGGLGHTSQGLAKHNSNVRCIVEDFADVFEQGEKGSP